MKTAVPGAFAGFEGRGDSTDRAGENDDADNAPDRPARDSGRVAGPGRAAAVARALLGIVTGGGVCLLMAARRALDPLRLDGDEATGAQIVIEAAELAIRYLRLA